MEILGTGDGFGPAGGGGFGPPPGGAWTPSMLAPGVFLGEMRPLPARVTLASGAVQALSDPLSGLTWTATSAPQRPGIATDANGIPYLTTLDTANTSLLTASGGVTGAAPHAIFQLGAMLAAEGAGVGIGSVAMLGQPGACSVIGLYETPPSVPAPNFWGGVTGISDPIFASDTANHVVAKFLDASGLLYLTIDGQPAAYFGIVAPSLVAGSGLAGYQDSTFCATANVYDVLYTTGDPYTYSADFHSIITGPATTYWQILAYLCGVLPSVVRPCWIACIGDSTTAGSNAGITAPQKYPAQLQTQLAGLGHTAQVGNFGQPGSTSSQILAAMPTVSDPYWSPCFAQRLSIVMAGYNDLLQIGASDGATVAALILANYASTLAGRRVAGAGPLGVVLTLWNSTAAAFGQPNAILARTTANGGIMAMAGSSPRSLAGVGCTALLGQNGILAIDVASLPALSDPTNGTYFDGGLHLTAAGYAALAGAVAAALIAAGWV